MESMNMNKPYEVPYVRKEAISLIAIGAPGEATALRSVLEWFNYRVEVQWVGSRREVLEILRGNVETFPYLILSCHGDERGGILVPDEAVIAVDEVEICLPERVVVNLGCGAGYGEVASRYLLGGCRRLSPPRCCS